MHNRNWWRLLALLVALAMVAAACGGDEDPVADPADDPTAEDPTDGDDGDEPADEPDPDPGTEGGGDVIVGTTDTLVSLDPARAYDYMSNNVIYNVAEGLVGFGPGGAVVEPMLAESYEVSDDGLSYTFNLREGVQFHNGSELTSQDVKFTYERAKNIDHPSGSAFLLGDIESIDTPDDRTVVINIVEPNITFLSKLAAGIGVVLPADGPYEAPDAPLDAPGEDEEPTEHNSYVYEDGLVGTGPYRLVEYIDGQSVELEAFEGYWGEAPANDRVLVRFFATSSQLKLALENGEVDVAYRTLSVGERADLESNPDFQVITGDGDVMRYIGFTPTLEPFDDPEVRRAVAAAVDRQRIADEVFAGAVSPLYSTVLTGYEVYRPAHEVYESQEASDYIDEPISFTLHYGAERYGPEEPALAQEIARMLNETGLFDVEPVQHEWAEFVTAVNTEFPYPAFLLGWYPSYIDPEYYVTAFYGCEGWLQMWCDDEVEEWLHGQQLVDDPNSQERHEFFEQIQQKTAEEAWLVPLFEGVSFAYARQGVTGIERTLDASQIFRYWVIDPGN